jgi:hypothetical protein
MAGKVEVSLVQGLTIPAARDDSARFTYRELKMLNGLLEGICVIMVLDDADSDTSDTNVDRYVDDNKY